MSASPARAGFQGSLSAALGPGFDSNPRRIVGEDSAADGLVCLTAAGKGRLTLGDRQALSGNLELGAKKFLSTFDEDVLMQRLEAEYTAQLGGVALGAAGFAKLRLSRGGARDYRDLDAAAFAEQALSEALSLRASAGAHRFLYPPDRGYDSAGPQFTLSSRWAPARAHTVNAAVSLSLPTYAARALGPTAEYSDGRRRQDRIAGVQLAYGWRGPAMLQASYSFTGVFSNSFGQSNQRHRLSLAATARLFWSLVGSLQASWMFVRYTNGIFLSESFLLQDDESQSAVLAKVALPLSESVDVEARGGTSWIALPARGDPRLSLDFRRHTASVGLRLRW